MKYRWDTLEGNTLDTPIKLKNKTSLKSPLKPLSTPRQAWNINQINSKHSPNTLKISLRHPWNIIYHAPMKHSWNTMGTFLNKPWKPLKIHLQDFPSTCEIYTLEICLPLEQPLNTLESPLTLSSPKSEEAMKTLAHPWNH